MRGGFEYALLAVIALLAFFCFLIGMDKMIKLIIGTTILIVIILWRWMLLQTFLFQLMYVGPARSLFGIAQETLVSIVQSIDTTTSVVLFVGLMIVVMTYTHLDIVFDNFTLSSQVQQLLLVPLAIMSLLIGLAVAVIGVDIMNPEKLITIAQLLTHNIQVQRMILYLPLWIMIQGLCSLGLVSSFGLVFWKHGWE